MQNKIVNGFTLLRQIGRGGMAEVWYAENVISKPAAVKILNADLSLNPQVMERFINEAHVMVRLNHPNIRQVYDLGEYEGRPCIIMEYLEGKDLKERMREGERFSSSQLQHWWNQLASALTYTHQQGVVHRDIKPSNIFVTDNGDVKLLDFGIAKVRDSITSTHTGVRMGTLMYMSPEQADDAKHVDGRSDVYSLAVTFVSLLLGHTPYDENTESQRVILNHIVEHPLDLSELPADWRNFLSPYLSKKPSERPTLVPFPTQSEEQFPAPADSPDEHTFIDDGAPVINLATEEEEKVVPPPPTQKPEKKQAKNHKMWLWILLASVVVLLAVVLVIMTVKKPTAIVDENGNLAVNGIEYKMMPVTSGSFIIDGCEKDGKEINTNPVTVGCFLMGETEVTQALWKAVMGKNPSTFKGDDLPVENVSWEDCQKFIEKLNALTGKNFRLPTEVEWEFAARGGNHSRHFTYSGGNQIDMVAWYQGNSLSGTCSVKTKNPNELGIYDMSGNVSEWCSEECVYRGGSWHHDESDCRIAHREKSYSPVEKFDYVGLRLVLVPDNIDVLAKNDDAKLMDEKSDTIAKSDKETAVTPAAPPKKQQRRQEPAVQTAVPVVSAPTPRQNAGRGSDHSSADDRSSSANTRTSSLPTSRDTK